MIKNYLRIAFRNLLRNKVYSLINVVGLAVGLTCAILLYLYIQNELSYDQYHKDQAQIFRLERTVTQTDALHTSAFFKASLAPVLKQELPEVAHIARMLYSTSSLRIGKKEKIYSRDVYYADASLLDILTFTSIHGDLKQALATPNAIVLNRSLAVKLFNVPKLALGETVQVNDKQKYIVRAIMEDVPANSHLQPKALISLSAFARISPDVFKRYAMFTTYMKLKRGVNTQRLGAQLKNVYTKHQPKEAATKFHLTPVKDIYLNPSLDYDHGQHSSAKMIYIFTAIAILIIVIASINYMNLATARSIDRAKEVGIRKVVGSHRRQIVTQFMVEAICLSLLALVLSVSLAELLLPEFNHLTGRHLSIAYISNPWTLPGLIGIAIGIGFISGSYPALVLSAFKPVLVLKGKFKSSQQGNRVRKTLVIFQFSISMLMMISTGVVYEQMQYVRQKDLGFNKEQIYRTTFFLPDGKKHQTIKNQLLQHPGILQVTNTSFRMSDVRGDEMNLKQKIEREDGTRVSSNVNYFIITPDFFKTMDISLVAGRNLNEQKASDYTKSVIVNEAFVRKYSWKTALGKQVGDAQVIGVAKDFHTKSLYAPIEPIAMSLGDQELRQTNIRKYFYVKLHPKNVGQTVAYIKKVWQQYNTHEFNGSFLNQKFAEAYQADERRGKVFLIFSALAIFIACLGLFGLASFTARQRTKEIGIRKVLGASLQQILILLNQGFVKLILLACLLAFPAAYYLMNQWLQNFAYRTSLHWGVFMGSSLLILCIALLTVSVQSFRVARVNPAKVLKDE